MAKPAEEIRPANYADYLALPEHKVGEIIGDTLYVFPRPAPPHAQAATNLTVEIVGPFALGKGGPGGWRILAEPELHLDKKKPVVPDLAGWKLERMSELPKTSYFSLAPDWLCEVLSPSTVDHDRKKKMPLYAAHGVQWVWLVDPIAQTLEAYQLHGGSWTEIATHKGNGSVRIAPFESVAIDLAPLWPLTIKKRR
jgi:hypothetical protein